MIRANVSLNDGTVEIIPSGSVQDVVSDLIVLNVAAAKGLAGTAEVDENEILDFIVDALTNQRDAIRQMLFAE